MALLLARRNFPGKLLLDGLVHVPLVLPPVAVGYLLLIALGTRAPLGAWLLDHFGLRFVFSWTGAALAAAIITFPFQVRAIRLSLEAIDKGLNEAAQTLGAGAWDRFVECDVAAGIAGHRRGRDHRLRRKPRRIRRDHHVCLQHSGQTRTLPLAIYTALQTPGGEAEAARLAALSIALALVFMTIAEYAARRARTNP